MPHPTPSRETAEIEGHTPGPWRIGPYGHVITPDGEMLRTCGVAIPGNDSPEYRANTRLIAAAPELLAELQLVYERSYNPFEPDNQSEQYKRVGALIARATGDQQS